MPSPLRLTRALFLVFVPLGLAAGVLTVATTTALGADEATETIHLEPGDNYVGWVSDPISVDDVFAAIPETALIYTWDADRRGWQYAIRDVGGSLTVLEPGMAAMIRIDGAKSVQWQRPLTPAKGMVTLYRGVNWVTWVGRDEWPLDQVARGIGQSLVSIRVGDETWPAPLDSSVDELPTLRRGDPVQVTVSRDLRWLQPTGMLPNIVWVGDISKSLKDEITGDIRWMVDFFAQEFAIETDFSDTTILIWKDVDSAVEHEKSDAEPKFGVPPDLLRSNLTYFHLAAAKPWGFFMPTCGWQPSCPSHGRQNGPIQTLTHEWLHHLQGQLSALQGWRASPVWMIEGPAMWAELQLPTGRRNTPSETERKSLLTGVARTTATLQSVEQPYTQLAYRLGVVAAERLAERSDTDAHVEYNRQLYPQTTGNERRWVITPTWQEAFQAAFGLTAAAFYEEFAAWRETLPTPARRYNYGQDDATLTGTVRYHNGSPAAGFRIEAKANVDGFNVDLARTTIVDAAGNFSIEVAPETMQRIQITRDGCTLWLTDGGLTTTRPLAGKYRDLDTANLPRLNLKVPAGACSGAIAEVEVLRLRGDERRVEVGFRSNSGFTWGKPDGSGDTYKLYDFHPKSAQVMVRVGGCDLWYTAGGLVATEEDADEIELGDALTSLEVRIPHDLCVLRAEVEILRLRGDERRVEVAFHSNSGFTWAAKDGSGDTYKLYASRLESAQVMVRVGGCRLWYTAGGLVATEEEPEPIELGDDLVSLKVRVPHDLCVRQISGRLIDADGAPISGVWLAAYEGWKYGGTVPDTNGEFTITVPDSGAYQLSFGVDDCRIRYSSSGPTTDWHKATRISVEDEDVTGIEFVVPADPASLCN